MNAPLVSIVIPIYNVRGYLAQTLQSVLDNDLQDYEAVLVDDGSTDGSDAIMKKFARTDPRFRWTRQLNQGPSAARNTGISKARGRYLTFLDADDLLTPDALAAMVASLEQSGSDVAVSPYKRFTADGREFYPPWIRAAHLQARQGVTAAQYPAILVHTVSCSRLYRRTYWDEHLGTFEVGRLYEDHEVVGRMYPSATLDIVPNVSVLWRIRDEGTSITQRAGAENDRQFLAGIEVQLSYYAQRAPELVAPRLSQVLGRDLYGRAAHGLAADCTAEHRTALTEALGPIIARLTPEIARTAPVLPRVIVLLAAAGRWDMLDQWRTAVSVQTALPKDARFSERFLVAFGALRELSGALPQWAFEPPVADAVGAPSEVAALQPA